MKKIFIIVLRYLVPIETINQHRAEHLKFLDQHYSSGTLIASGRQNPASGGIILASASDRQNVEKIIDEDPFKIHKLAEYQIYEFIPTKYSEAFANILPQTIVD